MTKSLRRRLAIGFSTFVTVCLTLASATVRADDGDLDAAISAGFGKLVKYGRWTAALILGVMFVWAWAEKGQSPDNPHEANRAIRRMVWTGIGFVAVIGYKLVLTGLVTWFNLNPATIPSFLWQ